jgi:ribose/xylose/arabinose/galactoside ABC-type transport system permease subunit
MTELVEKPKTFGDTAKDIARRVARHEDVLLSLVLAAIIAVFGVLTHGKTVALDNMKNILIQSSARGMAAIGQTFAILTGGIDLTPTGLALFAGVIGAWSTTQGAYGQPPMGPGWPLPVGVLIMALVGIGIGAANGALVSRVGIPPLIVTLAMWNITKGATLRISGGFTITGLPPAMGFFGQGYIGGAPVAAIIFGVSIAAAYFVLNYTRFGRSAYAVGGNRVSACLCGINVPKTQFLAYVISGFTAAIASIILMSRAMSASLFIAANLEIDSIASCVIGGISLAGGRGSIIGALIGAIIIGVINNGMNLVGIPHGMQDMAKGAIIVTAVAIDIVRRRRG